jgi:hypothetical protein
MQRNSLCHRFSGPSAKELDRDFWGHFPDRLVNFVGRVGQTVSIDVDANAAIRTLHVLIRFQSPDALFKVMAAVRTLKFDDVGIDTRHRASFILFFCPSGQVGAAGLPAPSSIFRQESGLSVPRTKHLSGLNEALLLD